MSTARRKRAWWENTVTKWRRSGLTAAQFADREGLKVGTLRWWSAELGRGTRAEHGLSRVVPIEIDVRQAASGKPAIEITIASAVVRCEVGTDVSYLAQLVSALKG
jgi:hypothetical protein